MHVGWSGRQMLDIHTDLAMSWLGLKATSQECFHLCVLRTRVHPPLDLLKDGLKHSFENQTTLDLHEKCKYAATVLLGHEAVLYQKKKKKKEKKCRGRFFLGDQISRIFHTQTKPFTLCMMMMSTYLYAFLPVSVTLSQCQGHRGIQKVLES